MSAADAMRCIGEPVSWPRLESFATGAMPRAAAAEVEAHVASCAACRACLDDLRADVVALPPLPAPAPDVAGARISRWSRWLFAGGGLTLAAAAVILLVLALGPSADPHDGDAPSARVAVKGAGVVVLSLVRERDGAVAYDASTFRATDRWKARVTCAPGSSVWADVVVYQPAGAGAAAAFPLAPARVPCGNDTVVPGAFRIDGGAALVCVALSAGPAPDRALTATGPRGGQLACTTLAPE